MKKITLAFLYNLRRKEPDLSCPETMLDADFDTPETIDAIIKHLKKCGYNVIPIEANEEAYVKLFNHKKEIDLAFNYSEGGSGADREAQIPAMLEMLQIPYTGSSPLTQAIVLNKVRTKEILKINNIPTAKYQIFKNKSHRLQRSLKFPLIVKPVSQGQSAGITKDSVIKNEKDLYKQISYIWKTFNQPAFAETFLEGREFSVSMLGNPPKVLSIVELNHGKLPASYPKISSVEVKFFLDSKEGKNFLTCPAKIPNNLKKKIENICKKTWEALEIRDWCRVDIRCDKNNNPFVLEVNSPASIEPPEEVIGYCSLPMAAEKSGITYDNLLKYIINSSLKRHGIIC